MNPIHKKQARSFTLDVLKAAEGSPMADDALRLSIREGLPHVALTETDLGALIRELEAEGYVRGTINTFRRTPVWILTDKGQLALPP